MRVRAFEIDVTATIERRVLLGIVEAVLLVRDDFDGVAPGTGRRIGFRVPDLAEVRRAADLRDDHDPAFAKVAPVNGAGMRHDVVARAAFAQLPAGFVGLELAAFEELDFIVWANSWRVLSPGIMGLALVIAIDLRLV